MATQLAEAATSDQFVQVVSDFIEYRRLEAKLAAKLRQISLEYGILRESQLSDAEERARDRAVMQATVAAFIDVGAHELAAEVFKHFIEHGPKFTQETVKLLANRLENAENRPLD